MRNGKGVKVPTMNINVSADVCSTSYDDDLDNNMIGVHESRTELDANLNMVMIGRNSQVMSRSGQTVQVNTFTPNYKALSEVPIADVVNVYEYPSTEKSTFFCTRLRCMFQKWIISFHHTQGSWDRGT